MGAGEYDLHSTLNDPTIYAAAVVGSSGYYQSIKAARPATRWSALMWMVSTRPGRWDNTVLANAKGSCDLAIINTPETPGQESDTFIVQQAAQELTTNINTLRSEMTKWGIPDTLISAWARSRSYTNPGRAGRLHKGCMPGSASAMRKGETPSPHHLAEHLLRHTALTDLLARLVYSS